MICWTVQNTHREVPILRGIQILKPLNDYLLLRRLYNLKFSSAFYLLRKCKVEVILMSSTSFWMFSHAVSLKLTVHHTVWNIVSRLHSFSVYIFYFLKISYTIFVQCCQSVLAFGQFTRIFQLIMLVYVL